jgi:hypothetical protein
MKPHLPVVGTTAATTAFCSERLGGPNGTHLFVDGNGKITRENGSLADPKPNAFSLVQIETCPGSTAACQKACYVHGLEKHQNPTWQLYRHNTDEIKRIIADPILYVEWSEIMADWIRQEARGGFRWHVSGDLFSARYAEWIADVCRQAPEVPFWIYTRSFGNKFLHPLVVVSTQRGGNLAINLSCDVDNYEIARSAAERYAFEPGDNTYEGDSTFVYNDTKRLRLCYLTIDGKVPDDLEVDDVIFPDYALRPKSVPSLADSEWWQSLTPHQRGLVCPVDAHGKSEARRCGPCMRCLT